MSVEVVGPSPTEGAMSEIETGMETIEHTSRVEVSTFLHEIRVETNGRQGGDGGHGGYLRAELDGEGQTFEIDLINDLTQLPDRPLFSHFIITARGDWEQEGLYQFAKAIVAAYEAAG